MRDVSNFEPEQDNPTTDRHKLDAQRHLDPGKGRVLPPLRSFI
jgi:hypothetical protein